MTELQSGASHFFSVGLAQTLHRNTCLSNKDITSVSEATRWGGVFRLQNQHMLNRQLWHQARNIVIAFCVIVLVLTSSSLWLNSRHVASDASDDSVKSQTQETAEPSASEAVATASASASADQTNQTQAQRAPSTIDTE